MSFEIPESVRPVRDTVLRFVEDECIPLEDQMMRDYGEFRIRAGDDDEKRPGTTSSHAWSGLRERAKALGIWAPGHPVELGGGGMPFADYVYINEVIGRCGLAVYAMGTATLQTCKMIQLRGSQEWQDRLLGPLVAGDIEIAYAMTEPDVASSDPTELQTTARLDGDEWVISGKKWFISLLNQASYVIVMCRTEEEEGLDRHQRFSMVIVPLNPAPPGFRMVRELLPDTWEIEFDDVRVPRENLLGERGTGFTQSQERLGPGRIYHCMRSLGSAQRAFDLMCRRANERMLSGKPLGEKQLIREMIFESYCDIQSSRLLVLDAAAKFDRGEQARVEIGVIKVQCARMVGRVVDRAVQVHGAMGLSSLTPLARMSGRALRILDGPDEVHIDRTGRLLLREYKDGGAGWDFASR